MTCIVGLISGGRVYMGADSAGVDGLNIVVMTNPKLFRVGDMVIGFTTSFRMGQLLAYGFTPPKRNPAEDVMAWMVTEFVEAVRARFKQFGFTEIVNNRETGGRFLVGVAGRLFQIEGDFQVAETEGNKMAIGCGAPYALGSMFATDGTYLSPMSRVVDALEAARCFSAGVRPPWVTMEIG